MKTQKMNVRDYWNQWSAWIRKICFGEMDKVVKQRTPLPSGRNENPDEVLFSLETFLTENYEFRYNQLKDCTERNEYLVSGSQETRDQLLGPGCQSFCLFLSNSLLSPVFGLYETFTPMGWSGQSNRLGKKDFERYALDTRFPIMDVGNGSTMDRERNDPCQRAGSLINQPSTGITKVHLL